MTSANRLAMPLALALAWACACGCSAAMKADEAQHADSPAAQPQKETKMKRYLIKTTEGDFTVGLYDDTPKHAANFDSLVAKGYFNGLLFHRVINEFMIQTGDPDSRNAAPGAQLGSGGPGYQIDAEIICPKHFNKRGALAAARTADQVNPERRSSGSQFYIVTGRKFTPGELEQQEARMQQGHLRDIFNSLVAKNMDKLRAMQAEGDREGLMAMQQQLIAEAEAEGEKNPFKFTPEQREAYEKQGGAPHLDGAYTVFGEVLSGWDTIDKIEKAETDQADRPKQDIKIVSVTPLAD